MSKILIFREDQNKFDKSLVISILSQITSVQRVRTDNVVGCLIEADYEKNNEAIIIRLNSDGETLSLSHDGDLALEAVLELNALIEEGLHMIDESYSYDIDLDEIKTVKSLSLAMG